MAKFQPGLIVGDIRGAAGNMKFNKNTFGNYIQTNVSPVNTNTVAQQLVRGRFGLSSQSWRGLTEAQRQAWIDGTVSWTNQNVFNQEIGYTGFSLRGRLNRNRQEINEALLDDFVLPGDVDTFTSLSLVADTSGGTLEITFAPAIAADHKVIVRATAPLSAGVTFVKAEFRKIAVLDNLDVSPFDLAAFYIAVFGQLPPGDSKVFVDAKQILIANGQNSVPLKAFDIAF